ncbi:hypothetical protein DVH05_021316 [Phytophthora capsici]|nr:hypothetical protein DVH05_021316 [Phytophthora capsici]
MQRPSLLPVVSRSVAGPFGWRFLRSLGRIEGSLQVALETLRQDPELQELHAVDSPA